MNFYNWTLVDENDHILVRDDGSFYLSESASTYTTFTYTTTPADLFNAARAEKGSFLSTWKEIALLFIEHGKSKKFVRQSAVGAVDVPQTVDVKIDRPGIRISLRQRTTIEL